MARLPTDDQARVAALCEPVQLLAGKSLSIRPGEVASVHFLTGATVAWVVRSEGGSGFALGLAGHEGAVGVPAALGIHGSVFEPVVQTAGPAWRADGAALEHLAAGRPGMLLAFSHYLWQLTQEVASAAVQSQVMDVRSRLAAWLLLSQRRAGTSLLDVTQSHLAHMLGVRRVSISLAASDLKGRGLIDYQRGRLRILDLTGLEAICHRARSTNGFAGADGPGESARASTPAG